MGTEGWEWVTPVCSPRVKKQGLKSLALLAPQTVRGNWEISFEESQVWAPVACTTYSLNLYTYVFVAGFH